MAQKIAPTKVGSKKATKKPSDRRDAHLTAGAKTSKTKPKVATAKAQAAKSATKPAPAKPAAQKRAAHTKAATQKAPAHKAAPAHKPPAAKAPAREAAKPAAVAPKPEGVRPPATPPSTKDTARTPVMPPPAARPAAPAVARTMPAAVAKTANQKIIAPAAPASPRAAATPAPARPVAPAAAAAAAAKKPVHQRHGFKVNEWIVYPAHGVGRIVAIEEQEIAGISLELFVITFDKDKMTLRVPTGKSESVGMRKLAEEPTVKKAIETLKGRARVKRTMWSRRAQEYEAKINSGDLVSIAEVVRDLYRSESQPEQSYSERQLYEAALDRMAREIAVVEKLDERGAVQRITEVLAKSARGRGVAAAEAA
jgi:CarD family transcriptional regulator